MVIIAAVRLFNRGPDKPSWHETPLGGRMQRRLPSGEMEYREMTDAERATQQDDLAW